MNLIIKVRKKANRVFKEANYRLLSAVGHTDFKKFIILARSRTGSNMLVSFLNSHQNIYASGEIFRRLNGQNYQDILAKAFAKQPDYVKARGFKIFYYHPTDEESNSLWQELIDMNNLLVIHLKRKNILRTLVSKKIAVVQDHWADKSAKKHHLNSKKSVTFTVEELQEGFRETREWEKNGDKKFRNHPLLTVYYEDLVTGPEKTFRKITEFLGVPYAKPETDLNRQNPETFRTLVKNYDELKSEFYGTEWQAFFED